MPEIFIQSHLLRVNDYEFQDGGADRDKYLIVLGVNNEEDEAYVIHCLTTSKNKGISGKFGLGCNSLGWKRFWHFPAKRAIGERGYFFEVDTFIFFQNNVRKYKI